MYPTTANTIFFFIINALILVYAYWLNKRFYKSFVYISLPFLFSFFMFLFHMCVHSYIFKTIIVIMLMLPILCKQLLFQHYLICFLI